MRVYLLLVFLFVAGVVAVSASAQPGDAGAGIAGTDTAIEPAALDNGAPAETGHEAGTYEAKAAEAIAVDAALPVGIRKRHAGTWKRHGDIWTSDAPPPKV